MINLFICKSSSTSSTPQSDMPAVDISAPHQSDKATQEKNRFIFPLLFASLISAYSYAGFDEGLTAHQKTDYAKALLEWKPLAEKGNAKAQSKLGRMYSEGHGVQRDDFQAAQWFSKAAEQGFAEAQSTLGFLYLIGQGVKQDSALAIQWTRKAASQGDVTAQYNLGVMYGNGAVKPDPALAAQWMRKAAEQGHADALNNLGFMYQQGQGVKRDKVLASMLFDLSAAHGGSKATNNRKAIHAQMTPPQIQESTRLSAGWKPGMPLPAKSKTGLQR